MFAGYGYAGRQTVRRALTSRRIHDHQATATAFCEVVLRHLAKLSALSADLLLATRYAKFRHCGEWQAKG